MYIRIPAPLGGTELHVEVSLSKILNPKVAPDVQMPSVRVLRWAGNSSRVYPGLCPLCETGFGPSKPRSPPRGKQQHPATLTDKRKENETKQNKCINNTSNHTDILEIHLLREFTVRMQNLGFMFWSQSSSQFNIEQGWATLMIECQKMLSSLPEGQIVIAHFHQ